ncbi:MAG: magnesium transporter CorA family protein [Spirochaetes bacterium]|nr:magnesium transporter CorA family protein [Spirochaetota bacterium]
MIRQYRIDDGRVLETGAENAQILVYINPDEAEKRHLIDDLKIDEHTLGSALDPNEPARFEFEPDHVAYIVKRPKRYTPSDNFFFSIHSIGLFAFAGKIVVVMADDVPLFEGKAFGRCSSLTDLLLKMMQRSIHHFQEHLKVISMCSDELEVSVNQSMDNRHLLHMFTLEKSLVYYLNAISSNGRVVDKMRSLAEKLGLSRDNLELIDDLGIENAQCYEQAQIYSQVLSGLMDARASIISNNLNMMMKNLNALVIAVAVPSFFAGVGGMSEYSAIFKFEEHRWMAYSIFLLLMVGLGIGTFFLIKRMERFWRQ